MSDDYDDDELIHIDNYQLNQGNHPTLEQVTLQFDKTPMN